MQGLNWYNLFNFLYVPSSAVYLVILSVCMLGLGFAGI